MFEIMNKEKNIIVEPKGESLDVFLKKFRKNYPGMLHNNVVVNLNEMVPDESAEIMKFYEFAKMHQAHHTSFVVVTQPLDSDMFPEDFNVVPTLVEAMDILEMEEISRDLGF